MKTLTITALALLMTGCCGLHFRNDYCNESEMARVRTQTENTSDGKKTKRVFILADHEWWEVFKRDLTDR